jgi:protoheme IX farnesyltransferase
MITTTHPAPASPPASKAKDVVSLFKLRIGFMIMLTALVGVAFVPNAAPGGMTVVALAVAVLLSSAAAGGFNQYYERYEDGRMARTRTRPFVTGALRAGPQWLGVFALLLAASFALATWAVNVHAAIHTLLGGLFYGFVYTVWLKRKSAWNIVIGGASGSFAVLAGAAAVDPSIGPLGWILAAVLFLWTPPHFWSLAIANKDDYAAAGVPMLPVVTGIPRAARIVFWSTLALVAVSLLPIAFGAGWLYFAGALIGGAHFLLQSWRLAVAPTRQRAMSAFFASLVQLTLLLATAALDPLFR